MRDHWGKRKDYKIRKLPEKDAGEGTVEIEVYQMFNAEKFIEKIIPNLQKDIQRKALIAFSGGVDSSVCAALVNKAIGDRLIAVHVNTGYMRKNEPEQVKQMMEDMSLNYRFVDASKEYYAALKGVEDPEKKRKIIGKNFIRIFEKVAREEKVDCLVQGTIAPDWIESGGGLRDTIKSHHNVGGLPKNMKLKLAEPLRDLYKDEVRKVARVLHLKVSERQPFPDRLGPVPGGPPRRPESGDDQGRQAGPDLPASLSQMDGRRRRRRGRLELSADCRVGPELARPDRGDLLVWRRRCR